MKHSMLSHLPRLIFAASGLVMLAGCSQMGSVEAISADTIDSLRTSGQILPFDRLNAYVLARHPGGQVEHAALDKLDDRYLYQALVTDPNKMQWFVELDAKSGGVVSDKQDPQ